jgi:hypothetical protein
MLFTVILNCLIVVEKQTADQQTIFIIIFLEGNIVLQTQFPRA